MCCGYDLPLDRSVMNLSIYLRYYSAAGIYFSFRWGPFVHFLEIVQWDSTRRDHSGYPGRVSGSGPVNDGPLVVHERVVIGEVVMLNFPIKLPWSS